MVGPGAVIAAPLKQNEVTLKQNQYIRTTVPLQTRDIETRRRYVLPIRFTGFDEANNAVDLAPVLEVEQKAMRLSADGILYTATLRVGLDDEATPGVPRNLPASTVLQISADRASADSADVTIAHTGAPYPHVHLTSTAPGDSVEVTLEFQKQKASAVIRVERPHIMLSAPDSLAGLGMGDATVFVRLSEDAGPRPRTVTVSFKPGFVDSPLVTVDVNSPKAVHIRTAGLGRKATVTAEATGLVSASADVKLKFPTGFFLSVLVGGGVGSLCARLARPNKSRKALVRHFLAGLIASLIGAGLYLLGVNVTGASIPIMNNELAVAVVAALVGIGGVGLLTKVSKGVGAALEPSKEG
jgi:hypothetical protein